MKRVGTKNTPVFRIVVADGRSPRDGKCIEEIGTYQPLKQGENFTIKLDRAQYWITKGAQPSDTVASFIKKAAKAAPVAVSAADFSDEEKMQEAAATAEVEAFVRLAAGAKE